jgi:hypothetical protein
MSSLKCIPFSYYRLLPVIFVMPEEMKGDLQIQ